MVMFLCVQLRVISDGTRCRSVHYLGVRQQKSGPYPISTALVEGFRVPKNCHTCRCTRGLLLLPCLLAQIGYMLLSRN